MDATSQILNTLKGNLNFVPLDTDDVLNDDGEVAGTKVVVKILNPSTQRTQRVHQINYGFKPIDTRYPIDTHRYPDTH